MSFSSRAVAGLVLFALAAACDSPTAPSRNPIEPSQSRTEPGRNRPDLTGTYTELPESMRTRTYSATIAQMDGSLLVTVHSPLNYPGMWNDIGRFPGVFGENGEVIFQPFGFEEWFPEEPASEFSAFGGMTATISAGGLSGFLNGHMRGIVANARTNRGNAR